MFARGGWKLQIVTFLVNFIGIPLLAVFLSRLFFSHNTSLALCLLLLALLPTSGMTISWTGFSGGNIGAAVRMTVIGMLSGAVLAPLYIKLLMGASLSISLIDIFVKIFQIVFIPMAAGTIIRLGLIRFRSQQWFEKEIKPVMPSVSSLGVIIMVFVVMALKSRSFFTNPLIILSLVLPLIVFYGINYLTGTLIGFRLFPRQDALALVFGSVMRNPSIALAIAMTSFGKEGQDAALIISFAYVIQVLSASLYSRHAGKKMEIKKAA